MDINQEVQERGWSDVNRERCHLINKDIAGTITAEEKGRLDALQAFTDDYLDRVAPRPTGLLEDLEERLRRKAMDDFNKMDDLHRFKWMLEKARVGFDLTDDSRHPEKNRNGRRFIHVEGSSPGAGVVYFTFDKDGKLESLEGSDG